MSRTAQSTAALSLDNGIWLGMAPDDAKKVFAVDASIATGDWDAFEFERHTPAAAQDTSMCASTGYDVENWLVLDSMRHAFIAGFVLFNMVTAECDAKCAGFPLRSHVEATVAVRSCVAVTFNRSDSTIYDMGPMYQAGATLSGALLGVVVKRSHLVKEDPKTGWGDDAYGWKAGDASTVFVAATVADVCHKSLPSDITVSFRELCCDTFPARGNCLVPGSIKVVEVIKATGS